MLSMNIILLKIKSQFYMQELNNRKKEFLSQEVVVQLLQMKKKYGCSGVKMLKTDSTIYGNSI